MKKLPILRWSLDALGLLFLVLFVFMDDFCRFHWFPCSISNNISWSFCYIFFIAIAMRGLILNPRQNKKLWINFSVVGCLALSVIFVYDTFNDWEKILWTIIVVLLISSIFIFFFWDRSVPEYTRDTLVKKNIRDTSKYDVCFYIILSSIAYVLLFYFWVVHNRGHSFIIVLFALPVYISCFCVWVVRGWKNKMRQLTLKDIITISNNKYTKSRKKK